MHSAGQIVLYGGMYCPGTILTPEVAKTTTRARLVTHTQWAFEVEPPPRGPPHQKILKRSYLSLVTVNLELFLLVCANLEFQSSLGTQRMQRQRDRRGLSQCVRCLLKVGPNKSTVTKASSEFRVTGPESIESGRDSIPE